MSKIRPPPRPTPSHVRFRAGLSFQLWLVCRSSATYLPSSLSPDPEAAVLSGRSLRLGQGFSRHKAMSGKPTCQRSTIKEFADHRALGFYDLTSVLPTSLGIELSGCHPQTSRILFFGIPIADPRTTSTIRTRTQHHVRYLFR